MIRLYQGSGSTEIQLLTKASDEDWLKLKNLTIRLLRARNLSEEAELLRKYPQADADGNRLLSDAELADFYRTQMEQYVLERNRISQSKRW